MSSQSQTQRDFYSNTLMLGPYQSLANAIRSGNFEDVKFILSNKIYDHARAESNYIA